MSSDFDTPRELRPGHSVVRLNRRGLGVVGGALVLAFVAGLVAIHEQGKRLTEPGAERRRAPAPRSQPWFQGIPDQAPTPRPVGMDTATPPASPASPKAPSGDEDEAQRRRRLLRQNFRGPTAGNMLGAAVGQQFGSTASEFIRRGISLAPTLDVRPGFPFNLMVTQDVIFPGPYQEATSQ
jgi:hypothetical protein